MKRCVTFRNGAGMCIIDICMHATLLILKDIDWIKIINRRFG